MRWHKFGVFPGDYYSTRKRCGRTLRAARLAFHVAQTKLGNAGGLSFYNLAREHQLGARCSGVRKATRCAKESLFNDATKCSIANRRVRTRIVRIVLFHGMRLRSLADSKCRLTHQFGIWPCETVQGIGIEGFPLKSPAGNRHSARSFVNPICPRNPLIYNGKINGNRRRILNFTGSCLSTLRLHAL